MSCRMPIICDHFHEFDLFIVDIDLLHSHWFSTDTGTDLMQDSLGTELALFLDFIY